MTVKKVCNNFYGKLVMALLKNVKVVHLSCQTEFENQKA